MRTIQFSSKQFMKCLDEVDNTFSSLTSQQLSPAGHGEDPIIMDKDNLLKQIPDVIKQL